MKQQQNRNSGETTHSGGAWRAAQRDGDDHYSRSARADTEREPTGMPGEADTPAHPTEPGAEPDTPVQAQVERRSGADRRLEQIDVEQERRVAERRVAKQEAHERRTYAVGRVTQAVDYLFYLLYGLLAIRFALALLAARESAGFVSFIRGVTQPFYDPFSGIVSRPAVNGGVLDFPLLIALLAYALLHLAVRGLLRLTVGQREA